MPERIPTPCRKPGCPATTTERQGYCPQHRRPPPSREQRRQSDRKRPNAYRRGYGRDWSKARRLFLQDEPLCRRCAERGLLVAATVVDHITPHKGSAALFWNRDNWQPLCKRCHDRKTVSEREAWY